MGTQQPTDGGASSSTADAVNELATALAVTKDDMAALTKDQRAAIAERKNANIVSAQMAGTNWGKGLDTATRRAVSDWGQRHGIDVTTEIFVLGGSIYLNAQFYINRLVELVRAGKVLNFTQDMVQHDARLEDVLREVLPPTVSEEEKVELREAQAKARREIRRRRDIRIMYGIPDAATAAVVTEVRLTALPNVPFVGIKWAPHPNKQHNDPVGTDYPQESAMTRSARRALKQCVRHVPEMEQWLEGAEDEAISSVDVAIKDGERRAAAVSAGEQRQLTGGAPRAFGGAVAEPEYITRDLAEVTPAPRSVPVEMADPYGEKGPQAGPNGEANPFAEDPRPEASGTLVMDRDLFGRVSPIEPAAEEREAARLAADSAGDDDMADLTPEERAHMERLAARDSRRGA